MKVGQWVQAKGIIFLLGEHQACTLRGRPNRRRPAQGQRSSSACFPSQRLQPPRLPRCSTLTNPQERRQRHARLSATAQPAGRVQSRGPAGCLGAPWLKAKRLRPLPVACCRQLHPEPPRLPFIGPSNTRNLGFEAGLCNGLFSFFCSLEGKAEVPPAGG